LRARPLQVRGKRKEFEEFKELQEFRMPPPWLHRPHPGTARLFDRS
jgi:hypothetical protein